MTSDLDELRQTLDHTKRRSPWTLYLKRNYPAFRDTIADQPADWTAIAAWAEAKGHSGGPIKPATARKAYERERTRREQAAGISKAPKPPKTAKPVPVMTPHPVRMIEQPARPAPPDVRMIPQSTDEPNSHAEDASVQAKLDQVREAMRASQPWMIPSTPRRSPPSDDEAADQLDAGREWLPKPQRRPTPPAEARITLQPELTPEDDALLASMDAERREANQQSADGSAVAVSTESTKLGSLKKLWGRGS